MTKGTAIHATCVAASDRAVLILGPSGSGKSDLALRLIDRGALLVSDDRVALHVDGDALIASSPGSMFGQIEVRGIGICTVKAQANAQVALIVRLGDETERLPEPAFETLEGISLPLIFIDPHRVSAPIKVEMALAQGVGTL